uniref:Uncharacterized protein n=1 Tax=Anopheles minimus TaxID=112268 RepID=A0A182WB36_9DIPT
MEEVTLLRASLQFHLQRAAAVWRRCCQDGSVFTATKTCESDLPPLAGLLTMVEALFRLTGLLIMSDGADCLLAARVL